MIEGIRDAYKRSQSYLTTSMDVGDEKLGEAFKKQLLVVTGFKREEISKLDVPNMTDEELHDLVKKRLLNIVGKNGSRQKVVSENELGKYLEDGWGFVTSLSNDRAIVRVN